MVSQLRVLAFIKYNCKKFICSSENSTELAISYWDSIQQIQEWKSDPLHKYAQELGKTKWYKGFSVEIAQLITPIANENLESSFTNHS